jgi:putative membrane protein
MKKSILLTRVISAGIIAAAGMLAQAADTTINANTTTDQSVSHKASAFIKDAAQANRGEIAFAQIAEQKSQNSDIKQLAQQLREDHQQADQKLQTIAQAHGVTVDQDLTWMQKREQGKLEKLSGAEFDKEYAKTMLKDHHADIAKFQKAAQDIQEPDVKQFAQEILPKLQAHLQHAEQAAQAVGVDQSTISSYTKQSSGAGGTADKSQSETGQGTK